MRSKTMVLNFKTVQLRRK